MIKKNNRKKKYIEKAIFVFKQDGLRLTLEEVAGRMGITKKTIYNYFSSKDELLSECIQSISADFQQALSGLDNTSKTAIENLQAVFFDINQFFTVLSPLFFYDIMRYNSGKAMSEHVIGSEIFQQKISANLTRGVIEGLYRAELDIELLSRYLSYSIFGFYINSIVNNNSFITKSYFEDMLDYNLRAIVSEKGKQLLKK